MKSSQPIVSAEESRPFEECCQTCRQPWLMWFTITQMPPLHITAGCILDPDTPNSLNHELEQMCAPVQSGFKSIGKVYRIHPYCYCLLHWIQIQNFHYCHIYFSVHPHTQEGLKDINNRKAGKTIMLVFVNEAVTTVHNVRQRSCVTWKLQMRAVGAGRLALM